MKLATVIGLTVIAIDVLVNIFSVLFFLRFSEFVTFSYSIVFLPIFGIYVIFFGGAATYCYFVLHGKRYDTNWGTGINAVSGAILGLVFTILLVERFDNILQMRWIYNFIPLFIYYAISQAVQWSSKERRTESQGGVFSAVLSVFVVLKLENVVSWSWWFVLMPVWVALGILLILVVGMGIAWLISCVRRERDREKGVFLFYFFLFVTVIAPLVAFLLTGTAYLERSWDVTLTQVFTPLFVLEGAVTFLLVAAVVFALRSVQVEETEALTGRPLEEDDARQFSFCFGRRPEVQHGSDDADARNVEMEEMILDQLATGDRSGGDMDDHLSGSGEEGGADSAAVPMLKHRIHHGPNPSLRAGPSIGFASGGSTSKHDDPWRTDRIDATSCSARAPPDPPTDHSARAVSPADTSPASRRPLSPASDGVGRSRGEDDGMFFASSECQDDDAGVSGPGSPTEPGIPRLLSPPRRHRALLMARDSASGSRPRRGHGRPQIEVGTGARRARDTALLAPIAPPPRANNARSSARSSEDVYLPIEPTMGPVG